MSWQANMNGRMLPKSIFAFQGPQLVLDHFLKMVVISITNDQNVILGPITRFSQLLYAMTKMKNVNETSTGVESQE